MDHLDAMRVLVSVVEMRGFSAAARSLNMPLPTVCRKIAELERHLRTQLLIRSTRKVVVTDPGRRYYESVRRILEGLAEAEAEAAGAYRNPVGQLTITTPALFGKRYVLPIIGNFMAEHQEITARLLFTDYVINLLDEHADIGIRIGNLRDGSLKALRVGEIRHCYCASPGYLATRGIPRRPEDLANHNCITFSKSSDPIDWIFRSDLGAHYNVKVNPTITVNMADAASQVARDGAGVAWLYSYQAMPHLGDGTLVSILNEFEPDPAPAHIVYPAERLITQRARYFIDFAAPRLRSVLDEINSFLPIPQQCPTLSAHAR